MSQPPSVLAHSRAAPQPVPPSRPLLDTDVSGVITQPTTWDLDGSPYILTSDVVVTTGVTLTIEPGVMVMAETGRSLQVWGHLSAVGTVTRPITFTSSADSGPEEWAGLLFDGGTGDMHYVTVRYGGDSDGIEYSNITVHDVLTGEVRIENSHVLSGASSIMADYGLHVTNSRVVVSGTTFANNGNKPFDYGLCATGGSVVTITGNAFENNGGWAVGVGADSVRRVTGNSFSGNERDRVQIIGGSVVTGTRLVPQTGLEGYDLKENLIVTRGVTLTVEPGVTVMGGDGKLLGVLGHLSAVGTVTRPITFTSSANSGPGEWAGLLFDGGTGDMHYVTVRYGGDSDDIEYSNITVHDVLTGEVRIENSHVLSGASSIPADYGLYVDNSRVVISGTAFANNGNNTFDYGLYATGGSVVTVTRSTFENNKDTNVAVDNSRVTMTCTTIANNQNDGIYLTGASTSFSIFSSGISGNNDYGLFNDIGTQVDARYNWWGDPSGPGEVGPGTGDKVSANVLFDPWLKKAMCASITDADLAIASSISPDLVMLGDPLTCTFTITNYGPSGATGVTQTYTLPANVTFGGVTSTQGICTGTSTITCALDALAINETVMVTTVVTSTAEGTITKMARVMGNEQDPDLSDNVAVVETTVGSAVDLEVTKIGSSGVVTAGNPLSYTITITNNGCSAATGVTLTDVLPLSTAFGSATFSQGTGCGESDGTVTCTLGTLNISDTVTVMIAVTIDSLAQGMITNTVEVTGTEGDFYVDDNRAAEVTTVVGLPGIYLPLVLKN